MKVGTDGTLLGAWGAHHCALENHERPLRILDVGTGTGLIALMMAQRFPEALVIGLDIDAEAVSQAQENAAASPFANRITIFQQDFSSILHSPFSILHPPFSMIVCNPPFFTQSLPCPDEKRTMARHDGTLNYRTLAIGAWTLLDEDGEMSVIVPAASPGVFVKMSSNSPRRKLYVRIIHFGIPRRKVMTKNR